MQMRLRWLLALLTLRVRLDRHELGVRELSGLGENFRRHANPTYVVNAGGKVDAVDFLLRHAEFPHDGHHQFADAPILARCIGATRLNCVRSGLDGLLQAFLQNLRMMLVFVGYVVALGPGAQRDESVGKIARHLIDFIARSAISESRWMGRWRYRSRPRLKETLQNL